jgi:hypothetical protein
MSDKSKQPRKTIHDQFLEEATNKLSTLIQEYPEVEGVVVSVNWVLGNSDLPASLVVCKSKDNQSLLNLMQQTVKSVDHMANVFNQDLNNFNSAVRKGLTLLARQEQEKTKPELSVPDASSS